jgi:hypothetical protein
MEPKPSPTVTDIQRYNGGVLIVFEDGQHFVYSADLLRRMRLQAENITMFAEFAAEVRATTPS